MKKRDENNIIHVNLMMIITSQKLNFFKVSEI